MELKPCQKSLIGQGAEERVTFGGRGRFLRDTEVHLSLIAVHFSTVDGTEASKGSSRCHFSCFRHGSMKRRTWDGVSFWIGLVALAFSYGWTMMLPAGVKRRAPAPLAIRQRTNRLRDPETGGENFAPAVDLLWFVYSAMCARILWKLSSSLFCPDKVNQKIQ